MKLISLEAENVLGIRAVNLVLNGEHLVVGGENEQGKTSLLNLLVVAMGGAGAVEVPLRRGAKKGHVVAKFSEDKGRGLPALVVEKRLTEKGEALVVTADGVVQKSPQTILNALYGHLTFDPMEFAGMKPKDQAETLRKIVGIDFTELDAERSRLFAERTQVNRDVKALEARLAAAGHYPDAPAAEVSVAALAEEQKRREAVNAVNADEHKKQAAAESRAETIGSDIVTKKEEISIVEKRLLVLRDELETLEARREESLELALQLDSANEQLLDLDVEEIRQQIIAADGINGRVRANAAYATLEAETRAAVIKSDILTDDLAEIDEEKTRLLSEAKWPVPGLGFDSDGNVTLDGLPLAQGSESKRILTSAGIGMALNPKLRLLLIRDGNALGPKRLAEMLSMGVDQDYQLLIERTSLGAECSVIIENGAVRE